MRVEYHTKDNKPKKTKYQMLVMWPMQQHILSIEDEKPSEEDTEHAADISYAPEPSPHASDIKA